MSVRGVKAVRIREHKIPSADSAPYICVEGPDDNLWFCESGADKIGCFDTRTANFREFALPTPGAMPIGIVLGRDGNLWFAQKKANKIGRLSPGGAFAEFIVPTPHAGPDGIALGPDGNVWFSETDAGQIGCITPNGKITEFKDGITPGSKPLSIVVRDGDLWFSEAAGNRIARITVDGKVTEYPIPERRPAAACHGHPSGRRDLVCGDRRQCAWPFHARAHLQRIQISDSERLAARGDGGPTAISGAPKTSPTRSVTWRRTALLLGEYDIPTAASGARCIASLSNGRLYFTQYDAGAIGEIILD